jgi:aryl-alcohol dehydrogenase-like predicted oxidoreductase
MLAPLELELLEDCFDDWRGLWEVTWMKPERPIAERAELVLGLIRRGLVDILDVSSWDEARTAAARPIPMDAALSLARDTDKYLAPSEHDRIYLLAITPEGEAQVRVAHKKLFGE